MCFFLIEWQYFWWFLPGFWHSSCSSWQDKTLCEPKFMVWHFLIDGKICKQKFLTTNFGIFKMSCWALLTERKHKCLRTNKKTVNIGGFYQWVAQPNLVPGNFFSQMVFKTRNFWKKCWNKADVQRYLVEQVNYSF